VTIDIGTLTRIDGIPMMMKRSADCGTLTEND